jgi:hypothetical protein
MTAEKNEKEGKPQHAGKALLSFLSRQTVCASSSLSLTLPENSAIRQKSQQQTLRPFYLNNLSCTLIVLIVSCHCVFALHLFAVR